jgi:hypothetical protein
MMTISPTQLDEGFVERGRDDPGAGSDRGALEVGLDGGQVVADDAEDAPADSEEALIAFDGGEGGGPSRPR